jgi:methionyl-tRNA formyltransferase
MDDKGVKWGAFQDPFSVVYFGTPDYAVPALKSIASDSRFELRLVVTRPDRPAGRGRKMTAPPVKQVARSLGIPVYQPSSLKSPELRGPIASVDADLFIVAAFGLIFGTATLALPKVGCINLHASLLPAYRGASPISAAIAAGDQRTGISIMLMDSGLDTGPLIGQLQTPISAKDTTESLSTRLADLAAAGVVEFVPPFLTGKATAIAQGRNDGSMTRQLTKADG